MGKNYLPFKQRKTISIYRCAILYNGTHVLWMSGTIASISKQSMRYGDKMWQKYVLFATTGYT